VVSDRFPILFATHLAEDTMADRRESYRPTDIGVASDLLDGSINTVREA
jgi:hypothetical protein